LQDAQHYFKVTTFKVDSLGRRLLMFQICEVKISEIAKITGHDKSIISRYFKNHTEKEVTRVNKRIVGIKPDAAYQYLKDANFNYFDKGAVILLANICGGVGKTTGTNNITAGLRRIIPIDDPLICIDGDPQSSCTKHILGDYAPDNALLLIDFLEGRATLDDILMPMDNNIWFLRSNLNQASIERVLSKPQDIKNCMLHFYEEIFKRFGDKAKIIQDHNPSLNSVLISSFCAVHQLNPSILRALLIPMRSDEYAINGARNVLRELKALKDTFRLDSEIDIHCYFSAIDNRISTMASVLEKVNKDEHIIKHFSDVAIRFSDEVHKSIDKKKNVYSRNAANKAAEDFNELIHFTFKGKSK
jgi:MinD-like ATPase involved in chromosome partitioning or flagellar assembly